MIARLKGKLAQKGSTEVIIDCGGVGYLVFVSVNTSSQLPAEGEDVVLLTLLIPREDALQLFGFINDEEREAFKLLISISGIGPKIAMGVLSSLTVSDLQQYILSGNIVSLQKMPGIGKKTAERIHLELKDKISKLGISDKSMPGGITNLIRSEAVSALIALGYSSAIAEKAVRKVYEGENSEGLTAENLIRKSLKIAVSI